MDILEKVLFNAGDYGKKKSFIENMLVDELMKIDKHLIASIIKKVGDEYGNLRIKCSLRKGNKWNSEIESVYLSTNNEVFVNVYVQSDSTDTTVPEYFDKFFRRGEYYSKGNRLGVGVDYNEGQKAEVMRSILLQCIYNLFSDEHKCAVIVAKLKHYSIINPICDHFYNKYNLKYKEISKYSSRNEVAEIKGYSHAIVKLDKYIVENYLELDGKTNNELREIYMEVFGKAMTDFIDTFDFEEWRKDRIFIY